MSQIFILYFLLFSSLSKLFQVFLLKSPWGHWCYRYQPFFICISTVIENNCRCALLNISSVYCALSLSVPFFRTYCRMYYKVQLRTWESKLQCNFLKMFATTNFRVHSFLLFNVLVFCLNLWRVVQTKWTFISILCFFT